MLSDIIFIGRYLEMKRMRLVVFPSVAQLGMVQDVHQHHLAGALHGRWPLQMAAL